MLGFLEISVIVTIEYKIIVLLIDLLRPDVKVAVFYQIKVISGIKSCILYLVSCVARYEWLRYTHVSTTLVTILRVVWYFTFVHWFKKFCTLSKLWHILEDGSKWCRNMYEVYCSYIIIQSDQNFSVHLWLQYKKPAKIFLNRFNHLPR
jgi:hypothetical protein